MVAKSDKRRNGGKVKLLRVYEPRGILSFMGVGEGGQKSFCWMIELELSNKWKYFVFCGKVRAAWAVCLGLLESHPTNGKGELFDGKVGGRGGIGFWF